MSTYLLTTASSVGKSTPPRITTPYKRTYSSWRHGWADTWGVHFNASKCCILSLQHSSSFFYQLNSSILQWVTSSAYMGIWISEDLKWVHTSAASLKRPLTHSGSLINCQNLCWCPVTCQNTAYLVPGCPTPSGVWCSCVGPQPEKKTLTWWSTPSAVQNATSPAATGHWPLTSSVSPGSSRRPSYSLWESTANCSTCLSSIVWLKGWYQCCLPINFWLHKNLVVQAWQQNGYVTTNTIGGYTRNNDRAYRCHSTLLLRPAAELVLHQDGR